MHLGRIEFNIVLFTDWSFASGCSPPRFSTTQLPSATDRPVFPSGRDFHPSVGAYSQAHSCSPFGFGALSTLLAGSDILQGRVSEQRLKLASLLLGALDHPGSGRECVRLFIGRVRCSRLSCSEIRFSLRRHDPVFAIQILFLRFVTRLLVGERNGFEPLVANRQDFLANPFGLHEVGDGRRQMPGSLGRG